MQNACCSLEGLRMRRRRYNHVFRKALESLEESQWWSLEKQQEYQNEKPVLHCYIELKEKSESVSSIEEKVHESLKQIDEPYRELEGIAGVKPIKITLLSKGTFQRYFEERQAAGADLAHLKPPHINPSESVLKNLLRMSSWQL